MSITQNDNFQYFTKKPIPLKAVQMQEAGKIVDKLHDNVEIPYESGDWIITGIQGEQYPVKDDVFRATYQPATSDASALPQKTQCDHLIWQKVCMRCDAREQIDGSVSEALELPQKSAFETVKNKQEEEWEKEFDERFKAVTHIQIGDENHPSFGPYTHTMATPVEIKDFIRGVAKKAKEEGDQKYKEIFDWLLGLNGEFPDLSQKPHYRFRTELRERLKQLSNDTALK